MYQFARRVTTKVTTVLEPSDGSDHVKPNVRVVPIAQLVLDEKNANKGTKRGRQLLGISEEDLLRQCELRRKLPSLHPHPAWPSRTARQ
jgi:hypothetical protein